MEFEKSIRRLTSIHPEIINQRARRSRQDQKGNKEPTNSKQGKKWMAGQWSGFKQVIPISPSINFNAS